jgi:CheY-like chemotaxis protein
MRERSYRVVLVVDDERDVREYAIHALRGAGFYVVSATDGDYALEILRHIVVDVVFTDIVLPGRLDGWQLAFAVRRLNPRTKVLCTTGFASVCDEASVRSLGGFLPKPYGPEQLRTEIARVLGS